MTNYLLINPNKFQKIVQLAQKIQFMKEVEMPRSQYAGNAQVEGVKTRDARLVKPAE